MTTTRLTPLTTTFASFQWLFFIFANTVVVPISIGTAFELQPHEIAGMLRSSLIFTGIACVLQGWIGHRFPLMEGHSGFMWGLFLNLCFSASSMGMSVSSIGGGIASGMLLAGAFVILMKALNLLHWMHKIFTPMVMNVYLLLLTIQLTLIFFNGMIKITPDGVLDLPISLFSLAIVFFVVILKIKGSPMIGNFSILIGIVVGWIVFLILFPAEQSSVAPSSSAIPIFPLGQPNLNVAIIAITFLASIINLTNANAALHAVAQLLREKLTQSHYDRSYVLTSLYYMGGAVFGLVSYAPFASSVGFLESTRIFDRKPFLIAGGMMAMLGIIPFLGGILATLPITVGNAVLFAAYLQLFGTALKSLKGYTFNSVTIFRLAIPVFLGLGIIALDSNVFESIPVLLRPLFMNGFIVGVLLSIFLELFIPWDKYDNMGS